MASKEELEDCTELAIGTPVIIHPRALARHARHRHWGHQTLGICCKQGDCLAMIEGMREALYDKAIKDAKTLLLAESEPDE